MLMLAVLSKSAQRRSEPQRSRLIVNAGNVTLAHDPHPFSCGSVPTLQSSIFI